VHNRDIASQLILHLNVNISDFFFCSDHNRKDEHSAEIPSPTMGQKGENIIIVVNHVCTGQRQRGQWWTDWTVSVSREDVLLPWTIEVTLWKSKNRSFGVEKYLEKYITAAHYAFVSSSWFGLKLSLEAQILYYKAKSLCICLYVLSVLPSPHELLNSGT